LISCNGKSQEKVAYEKEDVVTDSTDSLMEQCPIQQMKVEVDSLNIKLDKIKTELKKRKRNGKL
tara:strand:- start:1376 stop:1567 length:192 start_codon:yes stop_codon:yes gene_type:complete